MPEIFDTVVEHSLPEYNNKVKELGVPYLTKLDEMLGKAIEKTQNAKSLTEKTKEEKFR